MALTRAEREEFLAEPHIAALAVATREERRAPLTVPIWYQYAPDVDHGNIWIMTGRNSRKHQLIAQAGRFSLMVDRVAPSVRYVSVEGPVIDTVPATHEQLVEITERYLSADKVDAYIDFAQKELGDQVVIHLRPEHWLSADMGTV